MAENSASGDSSGKGCVTNPASSNDTTSSENVQEIEIKPKFSYYERDLKVLSHLPWAYGCVVKGTKFNGVKIELKPAEIVLPNEKSAMEAGLEVTYSNEIEILDNEFYIATDVDMSKLALWEGLEGGSRIKKC